MDAWHATGKSTPGCSFPMHTAENNDFLSFVSPPLSPLKVPVFVLASVGALPDTYCFRNGLDAEGDGLAGASVSAIGWRSFRDSGPGASGPGASGPGASGPGDSGPGDSGPLGLGGYSIGGGAAGGSSSTSGLGGYSIGGGAAGGSSSTSGLGDYSVYHTLKQHHVANDMQEEYWNKNLKQRMLNSFIAPIFDFRAFRVNIEIWNNTFISDRKFRLLSEAEKQNFDTSRTQPLVIETLLTCGYSSSGQDPMTRSLFKEFVWCGAKAAQGSYRNASCKNMMRRVKRKRVPDAILSASEITTWTPENELPKGRREFSLQLRAQLKESVRQKDYASAALVQEKLAKEEELLLIVHGQSASKVGRTKVRELQTLPKDSVSKSAFNDAVPIVKQLEIAKKAIAINHKIRCPDLLQIYLARLHDAGQHHRESISASNTFVNVGQCAVYPFFTSMEMNNRVLDNGYFFPFRALEYDHSIVPELFTIQGGEDVDDCESSPNLHITKGAMLNIPYIYNWIAKSYAEGSISIYVPAPGRFGSV